MDGPPRLIGPEGESAPDPPDSAQQKSGPRQKPNRRRKATAQIFDVDDCLRALSQLAGLLAMRIIRPAEANAMRAIYSDIVRHLVQRAQLGRTTEQPDDQEMIETLRRNPGLFTIFEPLLTDAQIQMVLRDPDETHDET